MSTDTMIRDLERAAAGGDEDARTKLRHEYVRTGQSAEAINTLVLCGILNRETGNLLKKVAREQSVSYASGLCPPRESTGPGWAEFVVRFQSADERIRVRADNWTMDRMATVLLVVDSPSGQAKAHEHRHQDP